MTKITLPKTEYQQLKSQAEAYRRLAAKFFEIMIIRDPIEAVIGDFKKTNLYTEEFLRDLKAGLRKSSYLKKYGNQTVKKRS